MIFITKIVHQEVSEKVDHGSIMEVLNKLDLADYSDQIQGINFIFIAHPSANHQEEAWLDENGINLSRRLDYSSILTANELTALQALAALFIDGIDQFNTLTDQFNTNAFKNRVIQLFGDRGWIGAEMIG